MAGADWRAGSIEEYQSQHVPIRSKTSALGLEGLGAADAIWVSRNTCSRKPHGTGSELIVNPYDKS